MDESNIFYIIGAIILGIIGTLIGTNKSRLNGRIDERNKSIREGVDNLRERQPELEGNNKELREGIADSERTVEAIKFESGKIRRSNNKVGESIDKLEGDNKESGRIVDKSEGTIKSAKHRLNRIKELANKIKANGDS